MPLLLICRRYIFNISEILRKKFPKIQLPVPKTCEAGRDIGTLIVSFFKRTKKQVRELIKEMHLRKEMEPIEVFQKIQFTPIAKALP
jgi:hypothetical protein